MKQLSETTEQKILQAAKDEFTKHGLFGARMQEIANQAGINKALLHYYFRSKERLFDEVFEMALTKFFETIDVFENQDLHIIDRLHMYIDNVIDFNQEYPQMSMFILKEIGNNPELFKEKVQLAKKKKKSILLVEALEEAIKKEEVIAIDTAMFFINIQSMCTYPFIAASMFHHSLKKQGKDWNKDFDPKKLKLSVKQFVETTLIKR
jgi:AcrR family transcriptional regulator